MHLQNVKTETSFPLSKTTTLSFTSRTAFYLAPDLMKSFNEVIQDDDGVKNYKRRRAAEDAINPWSAWKNLEPIKHLESNGF